MGESSAGKTYNWLKIARMAMKTKSPAKFYVLDTDFAVARMLLDPEFADLDNLVVAQIDDWQSLVGNLDSFRKRLKHEDWLIVDMISFAWEAAQSTYAEARFGTSLSDHMFSYATSGKSGSPFDGDTDWGTINSLYKRDFANKLLRLPGHVLATAPMKELRVKKDGSMQEPKEVASVFGNFGYKPEGQKHLGHLFHTILSPSRSKKGEYRIETVKDRSREPLFGVECKDFSVTYLVKVAGWKL